MRDEPDGADLLRTARETLVAEILPGLRGEGRYAALMVANALGMVERELASRERSRAADHAVLTFAGRGHADDEARARALCRAIRDGHHDGDGGLHAALYDEAIAAVAITRPGALTAAERRQDER